MAAAAAADGPTPMAVDLSDSDHHRKALLQAVYATLEVIPDLLARPAPPDGWTEVAKFTSAAIDLEVGPEECELKFWRVHGDHQSKKLKGKSVSGQDSVAVLMEAVLTRALASLPAPAMSDSGSHGASPAPQGQNRCRGEVVRDSPPSRRRGRSSMGSNILVPEVVNTTATLVPGQIQEASHLLLKAREVAVSAREIAVSARELILDAQEDVGPQFMIVRQPGGPATIRRRRPPPPVN